MGAKTLNEKKSEWPKSWNSKLLKVTCRKSIITKDFTVLNKKFKSRTNIRKINKSRKLKNLNLRVLIRFNENSSNEKYRKDEKSQNLTIFLNLRNFPISLFFKFDN